MYETYRFLLFKVCSYICYYRVRGLHGLRVMDASVMPTPISGHPNSVLIAMAEKAADIILQC
jgi:choline dehydrogenase-like flavoprotein